MKCLVTGGAGFIGSHLVEGLIGKGYDVTVIDDLSTGRIKNLDLSKVRFIRKKILQISREDIEGHDIIFHLAAQVSSFKSVDYPEEDFEKNAMGTFRILEAIRKYNKSALFVYTSSRSVHGDIPEPLLADESWPYVPSTFYNVHKIYGEMLCKIYNELFDINYIIIRPCNVYGPRQPYWVSGWYNFIAYWIKLAFENKPIPIYGTGEQIRDYVYVEDTILAYLLAIENEKAVNQTFLLPSGIGVSLNQLAGMIIEMTGSKSKLEYFPQRKGDIMRFVGTYKKAEQLLGWRPRTILENGLKREIEWMRDELAIE
jgi:UDP-glucose 4-epimerase